jgi:hypothetical protein
VGAATSNTSWNLMDGRVHGLFQNLLILYFEVLAASILAGSMTAVAEESKFMAVFLGILHFAGFQPKDDDMLRDELNFQKEQKVYTMVKNKFKSAQQAKRILKTATKSTSVQSFRSVILSCWKTETTITFRWPAWTSEDATEKMKADKKAARTIVSDSSVQERITVLSSNAVSRPVQPLSYKMHSYFVLARRSSIVQPNVSGVIGMKVDISIPVHVGPVEAFKKQIKTSW